MANGEANILDHFIARRKVIKLLGGAFTIHEPESLAVVAYVKQKAFKLKEDITVYTDTSRSEELLKINARSVIDFAAAYEVTLPQSGKMIGALRRKGFKSILRDRWQILDAGNRPIGEIVEDSGGMAFVRRFLTNLVPQKYRVDIDGETVGTIRQFFNPFVLKMEVDFRGDTEERLDRRLGLAAVVLLLAIEGRQN